MKIRISRAVDYVLNVQDRYDELRRNGIIVVDQLKTRTVLDVTANGLEWLLEDVYCRVACPQQYDAEVRSAYFAAERWADKQRKLLREGKSS